MILLTNPHGQCCKPHGQDCLSHAYSKNHECDFSSRKNTLELYQTLKTLPETRIELLLGKEQRVDFDLNRSSSKRTDFHKNLLFLMTQIQLQQLREQKDLIVSQFHQCEQDMEKNSELYEQVMDLYQQNVSKVLVLDIHSFPSGFSEYGPFEVVLLLLADDSLSTLYAYYLLSQLLKANIVSTIFIASDVNEIIRQAHDHGFANLLIEFNENLTTNRRKFIHFQLVQHIDILLKTWIFPISSPLSSMDLKISKGNFLFSRNNTNTSRDQMTNIVSPVSGEIRHVLVKDVLNITFLPFRNTKSSLRLQIKGVSSDNFGMVVHSGQCVFRGQVLARAMLYDIESIHLSWKNLFVSPVRTGEIFFAISVQN